MTKQSLLILVALTFLISGFGIFPTGSLNSAFAKPPKWAPAHGYRNKEERKHKHKHKHDHEHHHTTEVRDHQSSDSAYSWTYNRIDINNDGRISLKEWAEDKALFILLDTNKNGSISPIEYAGIDAQRGLISGLLAKVKDKVGSFWGWLF